MRAIEILDTKVEHTFDFKKVESAKKFARIVRGNEALDVVEVRRNGATVRIQHLGNVFDEGYFHGLITILGGDSSITG